VAAASFSLLLLSLELNDVKAMRLEYEPSPEPLRSCFLKSRTRRCRPRTCVRVRRTRECQRRTCVCLRRTCVSNTGRVCAGLSKKVDVRLPGKGNSNSHGARPVHEIISMKTWIRTSRLSIENSLSAGGLRDDPAATGGERDRRVCLTLAEPGWRHTPPLLDTLVHPRPSSGRHTSF
jgi:hypothetical protein